MYKALLSTILILLAGQAMAVDLPSDLSAVMQSAAENAQNSLNSGTDSQSSDYLKGSWMFVKRMCVTGLSQEEIDHPVSVEPNTNNRVIVNQFNGNFHNAVITQDGDPAYSESGSHCTMAATAKFASIEVNIPIPGTDLTLAEVYAQKQLSSIGSPECGPASAPHSRWKFGKTVNVIKIDENHAYNFLPASQLAGTTSACPNDEGYKLDLIERLQY